MKGTDVDSDLHARMARVAFRSPLDPVIGGNSELLVETHHPTWRYRNQFFIFADSRDCPHSRLTPTERRVEFNRRAAAGEPLETVLCEMALESLPSFTATWGGRPFSPLIGQAANVLPDPGDKPEAFDAKRGVRATLDRFATCLRYAADGNDDALKGVKEQIIYRDDIASFPSLENVEDIVDLLGYHSAGVSGYLQLSNLLEGIEPGLIPPFDRSVQARLQRLLGELPEHMPQSVSIGRIASAMFGPAYARAVGLA
jgi:hypothetical protein